MWNEALQATMDPRLTAGDGSPTRRIKSTDGHLAESTRRGFLRDVCGRCFLHFRCRASSADLYRSDCGIAGVSSELPAGCTHSGNIRNCLLPFLPGALDIFAQSGVACRRRADCRGNSTYPTFHDEREPHFARCSFAPGRQSCRITAPALGAPSCRTDGAQYHWLSCSRVSIAPSVKTVLIHVRSSN